ncbi:MAG: 6-phosphogluconolactonase, partial [Muribaculaceae bacterium]|nr:6-phosphogluconolactonase [Muribaculaceae bacterium]
MRTDLSSQIKLDRIPRRYYNPDSEIELAALRRMERIDTRIYETASDGADFIASEIVRYIKRYVDKNGKCVLALGAGMSTHRVYASLINMYKAGMVDFSKVIVFNISEFFPLDAAGPSTLARLSEVFLDHVNLKPGNIRSINPAITKETMYEYCQAYEQAIADEGGIDVALCEIASNGAIAFNEPGSQASSYCRLVLLGNESRHRIAKNYKCEEVPTTAITLGLANIANARRVLCMAWGENSAEIIRRTVEETPTAAVPASFLQGHPHVKVVTDLPGAEDLTRISHPWKVTSCEWNDKLIRRAIVWLCNMTGKPILKLTDKDYNDWGLGELLALYGSAYNVNIKIFNDLQHTITGWPGGKPNADDTFRPERANPYPKRVIVFSPHPDDEV